MNKTEKINFGDKKEVFVIIWKDSIIKEMLIFYSF
jgi:hypothetical protein